MQHLLWPQEEAIPDETGKRSAERLCAAAETALLAGQSDDATALLSRALAEADDPIVRADVQQLRGQLAVLTGADDEAVAELVRAAEAVQPRDTARAARLLVEATLLLLYAHKAEALPMAIRAEELSRGADHTTRTRGRVTLGLGYLFAGNVDTARPYLDDCTELAVGGTPMQAVQLAQFVVISLAGLERYQEAMALCRRLLGVVRGLSAAGVLPLALGLLSNTAYFTSEFDAAEMAASEALQLARVNDQPPMEIFARACLVFVHGARGESGPAQEHAEPALRLMRELGMETFRPTVLNALALLDLGAGRWQAAAARYDEVEIAMADLFTLSGVIHWRGDRIEALLRAGDRERAIQLAKEFRLAVAGDGPWERAVAARCEALLAGDDAVADALFSEAVALHAQSPSIFERTRTELCWAERLLARNPAQAADLLVRCCAEFAALGARQWAERAAELLDRARPAAPAARPTAGDGDRVLVRALGPLTVVRAGVPARVGTDICGRALRYVVAAGGSVPAEELIEQLWPESPAQVGPARLRTVLSRLRRLYGPLVVRDGSLIRWADDVDVDSDRFADLARSALADPDHPDFTTRALEAIRLYTGDLLPMSRYCDWAVAARERLRHRYLDLLDLLAVRASEQGDLEAAAGHLRAALEVEPLDESRYVRLIGVLMDDGRWAQARAVLQRAEAMVADLGLPISAELGRLQSALAPGTA